MAAGLRTPALSSTHPFVRPLEPWRDGKSLATLLEAAFQGDEIDASGHRMIDMLRNYGQFEPMTFGFGTSFVWVENGQVLGNASVQRNPTRRDTWIIGNVATAASQRRRGIGAAVLDACMTFARIRNARGLALQVDRPNTVAVRLYERAGFAQIGDVAYYLHPPVRHTPVPPPGPVPGCVLRPASWADRGAVWDLARHNIPDALTYAESFDTGVYRLGARWSVFNALNGNPERWWVLQRSLTGELYGAVRTRANMDAGNHHVELMLRPEAPPEHGAALLAQALLRFEPYVSKAITAAQSLPHESSHAALALAGFAPVRELIHMRRAI